ncbi:hypothetical protein [Variovorax sp.]|uniref:hypothetical protein n=1 Tax=Variovorax sp. TaxID=1871043 RepID=UPI002D66C156|nr:hypothetical protein [Variovorax sp.]HYP85217.1 hypothetical protein [Variovorax sp.]
MEEERSRRLMLRLMALADKLEQRDMQVIAQLSQQACELKRSAQAVASGGEQFARTALDAMRGEAGNVVQRAMRQAVEQCTHSLTESAAHVSRTAHEVGASTEQLRRQRGLWLWAAPLALIVGALLAAGGSGYLVWKNAAELRRASFGLDILQATRSGALTRCGDALCARVGAKPARYGRNGEYVLLAK